MKRGIFVYILIVFLPFPSIGQNDLILYTDKPIYVSGEVLAFKVINPDPVISPIIHAELVDKEGRTIEHKIFKTFGNISFGQIPIPFAIKSKIYALRCYTLWHPSQLVKNEAHLFIPIFNLFDKHQPINNKHTENELITDKGAQIEITTDAGNYSRRSKVQTMINVTDLEGFPVQANISISVIDSTLFELHRGRYYNAVNEATTPSAPPFPDNFPQKNLSFSSQLITSMSNFLLALYLADEHTITWAFMNQENKFEIGLDDFYGVKDGQLVGLEPRGDIYHFEPDSLRSTLHLAPLIFPTSPLPYTELIADYLEAASQRYIIEDIFRDHSTQDTLNNQKKYAIEMKADRIYIVDDFIRFTDTEDFINEVVPSVKIRRAENSGAIFNILMENKAFSPKEPFMFLNGYIVSDASELIELDINQLERIEVFRKNETIQKHFGAIGQNGVVAFFTKNTNTKPSSGNILEIEGLSRSNPIISLSKKQLESNAPVLFPQLYWNASINTSIEGKASFEFFTSDDIGPYYMIVRAFTTKGELLEGNTKIRLFGNNE